MVCGRFLSLHQRLADAAIRQAPRSQSSHLACEQVRTIVEQDYPEGWRARLRQHRRYLAGTGVVVAKGRSASMTQALPPGWPDTNSRTGQNSSTYTDDRNWAPTQL